MSAINTPTKGSLQMNGQSRADNPHEGQPVLTTGVPLANARAAVVIMHGRGADARDILGLASSMPVPDVAWLAPDAAHNQWYPNRFMEPLDLNEPWLTSALSFVDRVVGQVLAAGIPAERLVLAGFSQGACLALEYAARHAQPYGGVVAFAGGLIGPEGTPRTYPGSLAGTPVFIGVGDRDPHIPVSRVSETAQVLTAMGATVDLRVYPGVTHTVVQDQVDAGQAIISRAAKTA